jgi:hypothetical protein
MERQANRPPEARNNFNRPAYNFRPQRNFRDLTPEQRRQVLQNERRWRSLPPAQRQELARRAAVWQKMTPEQRAHIRNDILPKWRNMPEDRRQAIRQRLRVLQNMPESARDERLADPNFTRGMNEQDKALLKDLSHVHVGGPPDSPNP